MEELGSQSKSQYAFNASAMNGAPSATSHAYRPPSEADVGLAGKAGDDDLDDSMSVIEFDALSTDGDHKGAGAGSAPTASALKSALRSGKPLEITSDTRTVDFGETRTRTIDGHPDAASVVGIVTSGTSRPIEARINLAAIPSADADAAYSNAFDINFKPTSKTDRNCCMTLICQHRMALFILACCVIGGATSFIYYTDAIVSASLTLPAIGYAQPDYEYDDKGGRVVYDESDFAKSFDPASIQLVAYFIAAIALMLAIHAKARQRAIEYNKHNPRGSARRLARNCTASSVGKNLLAVASLFVLLVGPVIVSKPWLTDLLGLEKTIDVVSTASLQLMIAFNFTLNAYFLYNGREAVVSACQATKAEAMRVSPTLWTLVFGMKTIKNPTFLYTGLSLTPLIVIAYDNTDFSTFTTLLIIACTVLNMGALNMPGASFIIKQLDRASQVLKKCGRRCLPRWHTMRVTADERKADWRAERRVRMMLVLERRVLALKRLINDEEPSTTATLVDSICANYRMAALNNDPSACKQTIGLVLEELLKRTALDNVGIRYFDSYGGKAIERFVTNLYQRTAHLITQVSNFVAMFGYNYTGATGGSQLLAYLGLAALFSLYSSTALLINLAVFGLPLYGVSCLLTYDVTDEYTNMTFTGEPAYFGGMRGWRRHCAAALLLAIAWYTIGTTQLKNEYAFAAWTIACGTNLRQFTQFKKHPIAAYSAYGMTGLLTAVFNGYGVMQAGMISAKKAALAAFLKDSTDRAGRGAVALTALDATMSTLKGLSDEAFEKLVSDNLAHTYGEADDIDVRTLEPGEWIRVKCALPSEQKGKASTAIAQARRAKANPSAAGAAGAASATAKLAQPLLQDSASDEDHTVAVPMGEPEPIGFGQWLWSGTVSAAKTIVSPVTVTGAVIVGCFGSSSCTSRKARTDTSASGMQMTTVV